METLTWFIATHLKMLDIRRRIEEEVRAETVPNILSQSILSKYYQ